MATVKAGEMTRIDPRAGADSGSSSGHGSKGAELPAGGPDRIYLPFCAGIRNLPVRICCFDRDFFLCGVERYGFGTHSL